MTAGHRDLSAPLLASPLRAVSVSRGAGDGDSVRLTARLVVDPDDPHLRGHFPHLTVLPGVFVIDAMCQAMATGLPERGPLLLREVRSVRFLAPLLAGDELTLALTVAPGADGDWSVRAEGRRRDGTVTGRIRATFEPVGDGDA